MYTASPVSDERKSELKSILIERGENSALDARKAKASENLEKEVKNTRYLVMAEVLFVLLPFLAIGIVLGFKGKLSELPTRPEWALAAAVISGQAIVKCVSGFLSIPADSPDRPKVSLWITVAIVFSLTPSLLVSTLILNGEGIHASTALVVAQLFLFFLGLVGFVWFNWFGEKERAKAKYEKDTNSSRREDRREANGHHDLSAQVTQPNVANHLSGSNGDFTTEDWKLYIDKLQTAMAASELHPDSERVASAL